MNKKIIAFGASTSRQSINKQLATFAANQVDNADVTILDLNDFEMPIFNVDREKETGHPQLALDFKEQIRHADGIIVSFAEHNGSFSAAYKNVYDWISRVEKDVWLQKPMLLMATSPGGRGGQTVLEQATGAYSRSNPNVTGSFSLPSFYDNFGESGIQEDNFKADFETKLASFAAAL
ncbi:MAG: chromate reductase [Flavobacteriales bacterium]|jgi:chromate reductase